MAKQQVHLKFVHIYKSRHGKTYAYFTPPSGKRIGLPLPISSPEFLAAYVAATQGQVLQAVSMPKQEGKDNFNTLHRLGWGDVTDGFIKVRQQKTDTPLMIPITLELEAALSKLSKEAGTFVLTEQGKPFTSAGFGNWFRDRCNESGLRNCSAHGLRKACARRLAEAGCTTHQIKASRVTRRMRRSGVILRRQINCSSQRARWRSSKGATRYQNLLTTPTGLAKARSIPMGNNNFWKIMVARRVLNYPIQINHLGLLTCGKQSFMNKTLLPEPANCQIGSNAGDWR